MARRRKPKPFRATTEVKRRARLLVGSPPPVRRDEIQKGKPPKHKKRELQKDLDEVSGARAAVVRNAER